MDSLPEELRFQPMSTPHSATLLNIKTQPVSFLADNLVRFQVPSSGILNSGSAYIEFAVAPNFVGAGFPLAVGSHAVISRARLMTQGGRILADQRDFNLKQVCEKPFRTAEYSRFVAPYLDGSFFSFTINETGTVDGAGTSLQEKLIVAGVPEEIQADGTRQGINDSMLWSRPQVITPYKGQETGHLQQFRVTLTELFPMLYSHQLPVSIMETLYIELEWRKDNARGAVFCATANQGAAFVPIAPATTDARNYVAGNGVTENGLFLITDHIIFDNPEVQARIEAHAEQHGGIAFPFQDYELSLLSVTAPDMGAGTQTTYETSRELGANEYKLCSIKTIEQSTDLTGFGTPNIFGFYHSTTPQQSIKSINYSFNDINLYPNNDSQLPVQYDRVSEIYDHTELSIPRPVYGTEISLALQPILATMFFQGSPMTGISNAMNVQGVYLKDMMGKELQNGNSAIRTFVKYTSNAEKGELNDGLNSQFFIEYKRELAVSKTGAVMVNEYS
jgi:hypothetical protein